MAEALQTQILASLHASTLHTACMDCCPSGYAPAAFSCCLACAKRSATGRTRPNRRWQAQVGSCVGPWLRECVCCGVFVHGLCFMCGVLCKPCPQTDLYVIVTAWPCGGDKVALLTVHTWLRWMCDQWAAKGMCVESVHKPQPQHHTHKVLQQLQATSGGLGDPDGSVGV